jgi:hypothetical protein
MRKTHSKKLALQKDTVRNLDAFHLARAHGQAANLTTLLTVVTTLTPKTGSNGGCATLSGDGCDGAGCSDWCITQRC